MFIFMIRSSIWRNWSERKRKIEKSANTAKVAAQMVENFIWMDSKLQGISNDTKNTKVGVWTKKLCMLQAMKNFSPLQ